MRTAASKSLFATSFAAADMEHEWSRDPIDSADPLPRRWSCRAPPMATTQYASDGRRLPRGWVELLDEEGSVYYWHTKKDERLVPPDFP